MDGKKSLFIKAFSDSYFFLETLKERYKTGGQRISNY